MAHTHKFISKELNDTAVFIQSKLNSLFTPTSSRIMKRIRKLPRATSFHDTDKQKTVQVQMHSGSMMDLSHP